MLYVVTGMVAIAGALVGVLWQRRHRFANDLVKQPRSSPPSGGQTRFVPLWGGHSRPSGGLEG